MPKRGPFKVLSFEPVLDLTLPGSRGRKGPGGSKRRRFESRNAVLRRIARNVRRDPQVMVKITSKGYCLPQARAHAAYITRHGRLTAEDENGFDLPDTASVRDKLAGWRLAREPIYLGRDKKLRQTMHFVVGMPAGTDPAKVLEGARRFARKEFDGHQYLMVLHEPRTDPKQGAPEHPHVHIAVRALGDHGRRLKVDREDLLYFREAFAEQMRELGVAANASTRLERGTQRGKSRSALAVTQRASSEANLERSRQLPDFTLPSQGFSRLLAMARDDYLVVLDHLGRSQREEDLTFAEAARAWVDQFPVLRTTQEQVDQRIGALRRSLAAEQSGDGSRTTTHERTR